MPVVNDVVRVRLAEAEHVLRDLAVAGSDDADALRLGPTASTPVALAAALEAVHRQAGLAAAAAKHASEPGWLSATAPHWQRYLRWLLAVQLAVLDQVARLDPDAAGPLGGPLARAESACQDARAAWALLPRTASDRTELDSVVTDGRVYVAVDELADSLRERAAAFAGAARDATAVGDELGALVAQELAGELTARADALSVAALESHTT